MGTASGPERQPEREPGPRLRCRHCPGKNRDRPGNPPAALGKRGSGRQRELTMEPDIKANEDVKSQFKAFQEQQQRRLQNLMERKKERQNRHKNTGSTMETIRALSDLNLFKKELPVKEDTSKSLLEAENEQLQDQLREVRDENCRLYKLVSEKDFEILQLQKRVQEERLALSGLSGLGGDVAATKIVELAKKNREVTAEFESERARVKQLNHKVKELERELQTATEKIHSLGGNAAGMKESTLKMLEGNLAESPEVKALQEKLSAANAKVTDYRNQLQNVRQELRLTQKVLAKEVGEDVNIQNLLTSSGSWRGRAQQILLLQTRVQELEHKLSQNKIRTSLLEMGEGFLDFPDPRKLSVQEKNLLKIRTLEKEKKESLEKLTGQHNTLQKNHEELKKKFDASKARNQILCEEVKMLKRQIGTLLEKGKHDDELINVLLSQQKQMQEILKSLSMKENEKQKRSAHPCDKSGAAHPAPSEPSGAGRTEPARTVSTMGHTLVESAATEPFFLRDSSPSGRVEESSHEVLEAEKTLQGEQSDILEQQLEKLQVDPGISTRAQSPALSSTKAQPRPSLSVSDSQELPAAPSELPLGSQVEELILSLGIQLNENQGLKALLESTLRDRGEDLKQYQIIVEQLKDIFLQAIQQHTQGKG
ncbi:coiled-coil domain-containing protein 13 isoform X3 [Prinia subflava]|uniref:coiled-coil domain-containing protein 13 isoform X3 n=1 Tax=Prinia subflava TaxID=208062 RepID=UPI002FE0B81C